LQLHGESWPFPQCVVISESQEEYNSGIQKIFTAGKGGHS